MWVCVCVCVCFRLCPFSVVVSPCGVDSLVGRDRVSGPYVINFLSGRVDVWVHLCRGVTQSLRIPQGSLGPGDRRPGPSVTSDPGPPSVGSDGERGTHGDPGLPILVTSKTHPRFSTHLPPRPSWDFPGCDSVSVALDPAPFGTVSAADDERIEEDRKLHCHASLAVPWTVPRVHRVRTHPVTLRSRKGRAMRHDHRSPMAVL